MKILTKCQGDKMDYVEKFKKQNVKFETINETEKQKIVKIH